MFNFVSCFIYFLNEQLYCYQFFCGQIFLENIKLTGKAVAVEIHLQEKVYNKKAYKNTNK